MKSLIFLFVCCLLTSAFAEKPISWYPDNSDEISKKCYQDNELSSGVIDDLENKLLVDDPKVHSALLCQAKAIGAYKEDTGLDVEQLAISYYRFTKKPKCRKFLVQNCFDEHKLVEVPGEQLFKVIQCLNDMEDRNTKRLQSLDNNGN